MMATKTTHVLRLALALTIGLGVARARAEIALAGEPGVTGGLSPMKVDSIAIQREDLTLSPAEVRVRYEMRNDTAGPVTLRVAFAMPDTVSLADAAFHVRADGSEIAPEADVAAVLPDGRDITEALRRMGGLPLLLHRVSPVPSDPEGRALQELGALGPGGSQLWTTRVTPYWQQVFRPRITVLDIVYRPVVRPEILALAPGGTLDAQTAGKYCIDAPTERVIRTFIRGLAARGRTDSVTGYTFGYALAGANWRGSIGTFHFTLQGSGVATDNGVGQVRVFSLCTELPLRQTAAMRFEALVRNYVPQQDLAVLVLAQ